MEERLYAFLGTDLFLIENKVDELIKNLKVEPFNILTYDLSETDVYEFIEEIMTVSLLADKKVVKVRNPWFFYEERADDLSTLKQYFVNPKSDTTVIFMLTKPFNEELELSQEAKKYLFIETVTEMKRDDLLPYLKTHFGNKGYKIEEEALHELLARVNFEFHLLAREIEKLELYAYNNKKITLQDVKLLVPRNLEDNIFELTNAIIAHNKKRMLEVYYDLLVKNVDPVTIVGRISNQFKEMITTKSLLKKGYRQHEIKKYFDVSDGRAYYLVLNANKLKEVVLINYYQSLANLDYRIKSGEIDKKLALEIWLLKVLGGEYDTKKV